MGEDGDPRLALAKAARFGSTEPPGVSGTLGLNGPPWRLGSNPDDIRTTSDVHAPQAKKKKKVFTPSLKDAESHLQSVVRRRG